MKKYFKEYDKKFKNTFYLIDKINWSLASESKRPLDKILIEFIKFTYNLFGFTEDKIVKEKFGDWQILPLLCETFSKIMAIHIPKEYPNIHESYRKSCRFWSHDSILKALKEGSFIPKECIKNLDTELMLIDLFHYHSLQNFDGILFFNKNGDAFYINLRNKINIDDLRWKLVEECGINLTRPSVADTARYYWYVMECYLKF